MTTHRKRLNGNTPPEGNRWRTQSDCASPRLALSPCPSDFANSRSYSGSHYRRHAPGELMIAALIALQDFATSTSPTIPARPHVRDISAAARPGIYAATALSPKSSSYLGPNSRADDVCQDVLASIVNNAPHHVLCSCLELARLCVEERLNEPKPSSVSCYPTGFHVALRVRRVHDAHLLRHAGHCWQRLQHIRCYYSSSAWAHPGRPCCLHEFVPVS